MNDLGAKERIIAVMLKEVFERHPELRPELKKIVNGNEIEGKVLSAFLNTHADEMVENQPSEDMKEALKGLLLPGENVVLHISYEFAEFLSDLSSGI